MQIIDRINQVIAEFHLLKHPFYQAWSKGELSREILQHYAAQYYLPVSEFSRFISSVHTGCPWVKAREMLADNMLEEDRGDHPALWMQFAEGIGAAKERVQHEQPIPETKNMVDKFYELARRDWRDGVCALYAYECQVPEVSISKIAGLKEFYGIHDERTLEFFTAHQIYDVEHSRQVAKIIEQYVEPERAERATREAAIALWGFLDGMCREGGIACH